MNISGGQNQVEERLVEIKSSGVNEYPAQVKDVLRQHPVAVYLNKMKEFT